MLDNQKLLTLSEQIADLLYNISDVSNRGKTTNGRIVEEVMTAKGQIELINKLQKVIEAVPVQYASLNELTNIVATMPLTKIPLFVALLKLKYTVAAAKHKQDK